MAVQYLNIDENDFSLGIDARSAENQIGPGFAKDLLNADIVEKRPRTRTGYQGYSGNMPVRVTELQYEDTLNQVCFTLDSAVSIDQTDVDLNAVRSSPLVVYGRSSSIASGGPFTTAGDTVRYYNGFTVPTRKVFAATASAPPFESITVSQSEHGILTTNMFMSVVESTSTTSRSYQLALPHEISLSESTIDATISYQNSTGADVPVYVFYKERSAATGQTYIATLAHTGTGSETFLIPAGTHALSNFNIVAQIQQDTGTDRIQVKAEQFVVESDGDVSITLNSVSPATFYAILSAADVSSQVTGNVAGNSTASIVIPDVTSPWIFYGIYIELTPGGDKELVYPDSLSYDAVSSDVTVTFTNGTSSAANFVIYYMYGSLRSNQLCVTDVSVTGDATDSRPQLTLWGLDHSEIYSDTGNTRAGWVNHVDTYRSSGEQRLISGLGGNLFSAQTYAEAGASYDYALLYPSVQARTSTSKVLGPLFYDTGDTPARTRGYVTADDAGTGWVSVTAVAFDSGNGWTRYTLSVPSKLILDSTGTPTSLSSVLSTTTGLEDWLAVEDMSYSRHNGTFKIRQILDGIDEIDVWVEGVENNSSDYDDAGTQGNAGVFTDQFSWLTTSPFLPGDALLNAALGDTFSCFALSSLGTVTVSNGFSDLIQIAGGITTVGRRISSVLPLRTAQPSPVSNTDNLVRGDMLSYSLSSDARLFRVLFVNSDQDRSVTVDGDGETAVVTLGTGDTSFLAAGRKVLLTNSGVYTGNQTISEILSDTTFSFASTETSLAVTGTLLGHTAQIDEELEWEDSSGDMAIFQVESRWIPIEAPDDAYDLTPSTYIRQLDTAAYGNQPFLRSTMVQNNMYLTDGEDEVFKFDGISIYRAGLFSWQPGLLLTQDTASTAKVTISNRTIAYTAKSATGGFLTIASEDALVLPVGTEVLLPGDVLSYTVRDIKEDTTTPTDAYIYFDRALTAGVAATGNISEVATFRYYFRLNAVDANDNIIASAVSGSQDYVIQLAADAAVNIKLVGLPAWDIYDYDRLEVEIYRTKQNTPAPFYKITTLQMDFDNTQGYINYSDSFSDTDLIDLDVVVSGLKGQELGIGWQEPLRAKYVTSIANSLVLANVKDYPQLDIQIVADGSVTNTDYKDTVWLFRRDSADTATATDMLSVARYEFRDTADAVSNSATTGVLNTSFTITVANSAAAGDWVYLLWSGVATNGRPLKYAGWWQIAGATGTDITINYAETDAGVITAVVPDLCLFATDPSDIPVPLGEDGNMGMVNGDSFDLFDTMRRMSLAINASMRMVDVSIFGYDTFTPWIVARGGNDVGKAGRLIVRQPRSDDVTVEVVLPSGYTAFTVFVNDLRKLPGSSTSASVRLYRSRILISYENYPEIFDSPTAILDTESDSAIDINSADGQEITGVLPFFGEAAFGAAQQSGVLVVFKTNSIYLVDVNEKRAGRNPVQRIETEGLGCTAPYSIAVTKNGIMFANESGIYCLRRNQAIQYIGKYMERNWTERVDLSSLDLCQGHHYGVGRVYKLSVPLTGATEDTDVYVYNHTGEEEGKTLGAWTRYDNHPATGWANLNSDAFFGSTLGRVFSLRRTGTDTDFRDDSSPITFRLDTRAMDFGNSGIRKVIDSSVVNYRTKAATTDADFFYSIDLDQEYTPTTLFSVRNPRSTTGLSDVPGKDVLPIRHDTNRRRGIYFQARVECAVLDEPIEIAGLSFRVGGLTDKGVLQASQTAR